MSLQAAAASILEKRRASPEQLAALQQLELPNSRQEQWRYFPLRQLGLKRFAGSAQPAPIAEPDQDCLTLRWVDGQLKSAVLAAAAAGVMITERPQTDFTSSGFTALASLLSEQFRIHVQQSLAQPLKLQLVSGGSAVAGLDLQLIVEPGQELTVIEDLSSFGEADHWSGLRLNVQLGAGARLLWLRRVHDGSKVVRHAESRFELAAGAQLRWYGFDQSVGVHRHELDIGLQGEGASASVRGGAVVDAREYTEQRLRLHHAAPGCDSLTLWKLVANGQSRAVFNGRIQIDAGADRSDAQLKTANLLLSAQAEIDCKPELEIHADEVSAAHGATVGQLDERALFYLRSRGIDLGEARSLLTQAFLRELFDDLPEGALRQALEDGLAQRLPTLDLPA